MRRALLGVLLVGAALATAAPAQASHSQLAAEWHLDDYDDNSQVFDSSGHGLTGIAKNGAGFVVGGGRFGNAFQFTVANQSRVEVPDSPELEPQRVTLFTWVKRSGPPGQYRWVFGKGAQGCEGASYGLSTGDGQGLQFTVYDGAAYSSPDAGTAIWDGQWHAVAGTYDGSTVRLYVDGQQVGAGTPLPNSAPRYGLQFEQTFIGAYPGMAFCAFNYVFTGLIDETRVYNRALSANEIAFLSQASHATPPVLPPPDPGGGPGPDPGPEPGPGPGPGGVKPPVVTGMRPALQFAGGKSAVLSAQVTGEFDRLEWNLGGDSRPEIIGGPGQTSVRFRPKPGQVSVTVTPVGPVGSGAPMTEVFTAPAATAGSALDRKLANAAAKLPPVYGTGGEVELTLPNPRNLNNPCVAASTLVRSGGLELDGCLLPIDELSDIPVAERGIIERLGARFGIGRKDRETGIWVRTGISLTDAYLATSAVVVNGVKLTPAPGAAIVVYPQANAIASSDARLSAGGLQLANRRDFILDTTVKGGSIDFGSFPLSPGSIKGLGGFSMLGDVKVNVLPRTGVTPAGAEITANLQLPSFLTAAGVRFQSSVKTRAVNDRLILDAMRIGPLNADIGAVSVEDFRLDYMRTGEGDEWRGQGKACVIGGACLDMIPPNGSVVIKNGELDFAGASLIFPPPGIPLFPGLALDRIGFGFGLNPTRVTGNAKVTALKIYEIDGRLLLAFPSPSTPYVFDANEAGPGYPAHFYGRRHTAATFAVAANASIKVPVVGNVPLGNGYFLYEYPGYVAFGGGLDQDFLSVLIIRGVVSGEFNTENGRFNIEGDVRACITELFCRGAHGVVSSRALAACLLLGPISPGVGVIYSPFEIVPYPIDGCKWSPYRETRVRGKLAAAQAGSPHVVTVEEGDPSRAIKLDGAAGAAPRVRVTGPGGQVLESGAEPVVSSGALRIMELPKVGITAVGLQDPRPGEYRIEPLDGSPAITKIMEAEEPPDAKVTATVSGSGLRRVLTYDIRERPAQRVAFFEVAPDGSALEIGRVSGGGKGTLAFKPSPGVGNRAIEARFELDGLPAETVQVARFGTPSMQLAKPAGLRVRRRGTALTVSWKRVPEATGYEVVTTTSGERQLTQSSKRTKLVIRRIPRSSAGRVSVRAVDSLRRGRVSTARFGRTAQRESSFVKLPKPPPGA